MGSIGLHAGSTDSAVCPVVKAEATFLVFKAAVTSCVAVKVWTVIPDAGDMMRTVHSAKGNANDKQGRHHANH